MYLSVIIPAYNEEKRIGRTLEEVCAYVRAKPWESEIIVVSDGSSDRTAKIAGSFAGSSPSLRTVEYFPNRGKGYAVRQGMGEAQGDVRLFMDADNATPITEFDKLLPHLAAGYEVVIGSLGVAGAEFDRKKLFWRMVAGRLGNWLIQFVLLWGIYDTQRGFKLFTKRAAETIFPLVKVNRWAFDIELLALARRHGFRIKEVPVAWHHMAESKVTPLSYLQVLMELFRIKARFLCRPPRRVERERGTGQMAHADYCAQFVAPGGAVLDVGSGRGSFLIEMATLGFKAVGVDTSSDYLREATEEARKAGVTLKLRQARAEELPFPEGSVDFVNCAEVTEHVGDPVGACREIFRVLRPGGHCYISFHNRFGFYDYHYHLFGINWLPRSLTEPLLSLLQKQKEDSKETGRQKLTSMHYYRYGEITRLLKELGFAVYDIRTRKIASRFGDAAPFLRVVYHALLRPFYFNTFHLLLRKP